MILGKIARRVLKSPNPVSRLGLMAYRAGAPARYWVQKMALVPRWLITSREVTNYTYDLSERNLLHLANMVSLITGVCLDQVKEYLAEPGRDMALQAHIADATRSSRLRSLSDETARFGKRLGWYAIVRATGPRVVIETGVDKGLGSILLCAALQKNTAGGRPGVYYGTDINPEAGYLLGGPWADYGRILYGDSLDQLKMFSEEIDLFINDSNHAPEYERAEYYAVKDKLSKAAIILSDNAHCSESLCEFAFESNRRFLFFAEQPAKHWYPGGGIGICFPNPGQVSNG